LLGGFAAWRDAGYPLEGKKSAPAAGVSDAQRTKEIQENLQKAEGDPEATE
jgi:3-mercaptopyruvate sulfurtransferase SseA